MLGSYITSHNEYSVESCDESIEQLNAFLEVIPPEEEGDIKRVKQCLEIVERERRRCLEEGKLKKKKLQHETI